MKKIKGSTIIIIILLVIVAILIYQDYADSNKPSTKDSIYSSNYISTTVYVTNTGEKYHRSDCSYLRQSKIPISLSNAKKNYTPCSRCNPPR